jgi:hypothetical protein
MNCLDKAWAVFAPAPNGLFDRKAGWLLFTLNCWLMEMDLVKT